MEIYWLSLFVCIIGAVIYFVTGNPTTPPPGTINTKFNVIGLHMFWVGLFVFLLKYDSAINLLHK